MRLLGRIRIVSGNTTRAIELLHGDLTRIPAEHSVDLLAVSAFPNDYQPTPASLIGALDRCGVSVAALAEDKASDLRREFSCWVSKPVEGQRFERILCVESAWKGSPPEITSDLFRALAPLVLDEYPEVSVAMPILATGDQDWPVEVMLEALVDAAADWMRRGLPLTTLKIVAYSDEDAEAARRVWRKLQPSETLSPTGGTFVAKVLARVVGLVGSLVGDVVGPVSGRMTGGAEGDGAAETVVPASRPAIRYDVFVSYAHANAEAANSLIARLRRERPSLRVFVDAQGLRAGAAWVRELSVALDSSRCVVAFHSPEYWQSKWCPLELSAALINRQQWNQQLFQIFYSDVYVPSMYLAIQYVDCRERDTQKLEAACLGLLGVLEEA